MPGAAPGASTTAFVSWEVSGGGGVTQVTACVAVVVGGTIATAVGIPGTVSGTVPVASDGGMPEHHGIGGLHMHHPASVLPG